MNRGYTGRIVFTLILILLSLWVLVPTYQWMSIPFTDRIKNETPKLAELRKQLDALPQEDPQRVEIQKQIGDEVAWIKRVSSRSINLGLDLQGGAHLVLQVHGDVASETMQQSGQAVTDQVIAILRNRIDGLGVRESSITSLPGNRVLVECPGTDPEDLKEIIQKTALLSFHLEMPWDEFLPKITEIDKNLNAGLMGAKLRAHQGGELRMSEADVSSVSAVVFSPDFANQLDRKYKLVLSTLQTEQGSRAPYRTLHAIEKYKEVGGDLIEHAFAYRDPQNGEFEVSLAFDRKGTKDFARVTGKNVGRNLAIVLDGYLVSHPVVREAIQYGQARISGGNMGYDEARMLAVSLNAGALPAAIEIVEDRSVSPSLGEDSIRAGGRAMAVSFVLVVVFMAVYYLVPGVIANMSLFLNMFFLLACLALAHATLTLPGIAGGVLLIGTAIDSSVLIYERIREELKTRAERKSVAAIIDKGYDKAFFAIFDSNVTTLITAFVLLTFGTGPIKGFAVTLIFGILISLFTSLFVSRLLMDLWFVRRRLETLNIGKLRILDNLNTDIFMRKRKLWYAISGGMCAVALILFLVVGVDKGIDFTGGTKIELTVPNSNVEAIRATIAQLGMEDASIQSDVHQPDLYSIKVSGSKQLAPTVVQGYLQKALGARIAGFAAAPPAEFAKLGTISGKNFAHVQVKPGVGRDDIDASLSASGFEGSVILAASETSNLYSVGLNTGDILVHELHVARKDVRSIDEVGPTIGKELVWKAVMSIIYSCFFIIIYVWIRFQFSFGLAGVVALIHDVTITVGAFSLCKLLPGVEREVNLPVIAAYLTIIGYSLNDTIVVFDRIRENLATGRGRLEDLINTSICQVLSRTFLTSGGTLLTVLVLFLFGGAVINDFAFALLVGIGVGTYSSVFVASPLLVDWAHYWQRRAEKKNPALARARVKAASKART